MDRLKKLRNKARKAAQDTRNLVKPSNKPASTATSPKKSKKGKFRNPVSSLFVKSSSGSPEPATEPTNEAKKSKKGNFWNPVSSVFAKFTSGPATELNHGATQPTTPLPESAGIYETEVATDAPIVPIVTDTPTDEDNNEADLVITSAESVPHSSITTDTETTAVDEPQAPINPDASSIAEDVIGPDPDFDPIWGLTYSISAEAIEKLAMEYAPTGAVSASYLGTRAGQNNSVSFVEYHPGNEKRCVRVPASGWEGKWSQEDRDQLTRSNNIMRYLKQNTAIPVPEVFHWDTELDNVIGAPYTIMAAVDGESPKDIWFKGVFAENNPMDADYDMNADCGFGFKRVNQVKGLEAKRQNILKSLATTLAEFRHLKFDKLGSLSCPDGGDGPLEVIPFSNLCYGRKEVGYSAESGMDGKCFNHTISSLQFLLGKMKSQFEYDEEDPIDADTNSLTDSEDEPPMDADIKRGLEKLYRIVLCCLPIPPRGKPETFVLAPPDFGSQNIKCNEDGEITALLDWDCIDTRPRLIGWCLPPDWLSMDWYRSERYTWPDHVMAPKDFDKYRNYFAGYLKDSCDDPNEVDDWKYATKAPMFDAIIESLIFQDEDRMLDTMLSLLQTFLPRVNLRELLRQIGRMQREGRDMGSEMTDFFYKKFQILFDSVGDDYDSDDEDEDVKVVAESTKGQAKGEEEDEDMDLVRDETTNAKRRVSDVSVEDLQDLQDLGRKQDADQISLNGNRARSSLPKRLCKSCRN